MFEFEWPWIWLLLPLPLLVWLFWPRAKQQSSALNVPFFTQVDQLGQSTNQSSGASALRAITLSAIWLCLLACCARPIWYGEVIELPLSGRDLLLAVDISGSMDTKDMVVSGSAIDRLSVVKFVVGEFVQRREQDRLGLILFGTNAYLQAPLTFDRATVNTLLQEAQLGFAGEKTAIGEAIGLAIKRLQAKPESDRVVILLTDGANTAGAVSPLQAAELAAQAGVKVYTIGVGADEIIMRSIFSPRGQRVNPSRDLDEQTLQAIADVTGGQYFRARNPEELVTIYQELDKLEPSEKDADSFRPKRTLFYWPLIVGLAISIAWSFVSAITRNSRA